jgi:hypothetical protein
MQLPKLQPFFELLQPEIVVDAWRGFRRRRQASSASVAKVPSQCSPI